MAVSEEYRRVLHEWARTLLPARIGDVEITDVVMETSEGRAWSEVTIEDARLSVIVKYRANGSERIYYTGTNLEDGGVVMSKLLHELFAIAARQETNP